MSTSSPLTPMSDTELLAVVNGYIQDGMTYQQSDLSNQISNSIRYYYGEKMGNEVVGRSSVVSKDVADAVDWIMPSLMRIFAGNKSVVDFSSTTKDHIKEARQAQDYVNYLYNTANDGFMNSYSVIQDTLLAKNGIMKHYYEDVITAEFDSFKGLSLEQVELLLVDLNAELMAMSEAVVDDNGNETFDVEISTRKVCRQLKIEAIPPEEFIIDTWSSTIEDSSCSAHQRNVSRSDLVAMGYDAELVYSLPSASVPGLSTKNSGAVTRARNSNDNAQYVNVTTSLDASQEQVLVTEALVKIDYDGDGIAEQRRIVISNDNLLSNERYEEPLFTDFRAHIIAHKFYGLSMYDMLGDIQKIKTTLLRNLLDNMYTLNNGRYEVVDGQVNMDDLLHNKLGGVVRTKMAGAIKQLDTPALPVQNFTMLEYLDNLKDNRTGISNTTRGMAGDVLHSNQSGSAVADVMSAAEQKQELIARILAHSFSKLFSNIYKLTLLNVDKEEIFKVRGEYVAVNPADWRKDYRVQPAAGIGQGKSAEKIMNAQMMMSLTQALAGSGAEGILFDWNTTYELVTEISENAGYEETHKYWLNPDTETGKMAIAKLEQARAQPSIEQQKLQAETQLKQQDLQNDASKIQITAQSDAAEMEIRKREVAVKERQLDLDQQKLDNDRYELDLKHALGIAEVQLEMTQGRAVGLGDGQVPNPRDGNLPNG